MRGLFHAAVGVIIAFEKPKGSLMSSCSAVKCHLSDVKCVHLSRKLVEHVLFLWHNDGLKPEMARMLSLHACQKGGTLGKYQQSPGWVTIFQDPMGCLSCFNCANSGKQCPQSLQQGWTTDFILHQRFQLGYTKGSHTSIHQVDAN